MLREIIALFSLVILVMTLSVSAGSAENRTELKSYEYDYGANNVLRIYAGNKSKLRLTSIPENIDLIQIAKTNSLSPLGMKFLGSRNQEVLSSNNYGNYVEFALETDEEVDKLAKLKLKAFEIDRSGSYSVIEETTIPVYSMQCGDGKPVCALVKMQCSQYDKNCKYEEKRSFPSSCEMNKVAAEFLYDGICNLS